MPTKRPRPGPSSPRELRLASLLSSIVNALPIVAYAFDANGTILLMEGQALEGMGSRPGARVGESVFDVFAGESETIAHLERALGGERHEADLRLAGNGRSYHVWYTPTLTSEGTVAMVTGLSLDVTESDLAQVELRRATRWLEQMLDRFPVAICQVNSEGILTMVRGVFIQESTNRQVGQGVADAFEQFPQLVEGVEAALAGQDQAFSLNDHGRSFEFLLTGMVDESGQRGILGVCIEVTEQRRVADALVETEQKSKFLASVSHELRTPLSSLLGFAELLEVATGSKLDEKEKRFLGNIRRSGQHVVRLVDQLLELSRWESGAGSKLLAEPVDVDELVVDVIERMTPLANARCIDLTAGRRAHQVVESDRLAILQVLLNMVSNAIKFTPHGGRVTVGCYHRSDDLHFLVRDTGIGIAPEHQERIFEEFYQVRSADPTVPSGSGLGLALSRNLARALGGDLIVHSRAGGGSTFEFRLPLGSLPALGSR